MESYTSPNICSMHFINHMNNLINWFPRVPITLLEIFYISFQICTDKTYSTLLLFCVSVTIDLVVVHVIHTNTTVYCWNTFNRSIITTNTAHFTNNIIIITMKKVDSPEGGGTLVNHVVIHEQKNAGKGTFLRIVVVCADRV